MCLLLVTDLLLDCFSTQVTFVEGGDFSATKEKTAHSSEVTLVERTTQMEGERTMTLQGDPSLSSDLPSAQDDFEQVRQ